MNPPFAAVSSPSIALTQLKAMVDELDVEGILAFAERTLPRASDLWVQASLDYKQQLQQLFFPEGIAYDGKSVQSLKDHGHEDEAGGLQQMPGDRSGGEVFYDQVDPSRQGLTRFRADDP